MDLPEGVLNDSGKEFDPVRGYGWKGPNGEEADFRKTGKGRFPAVRGNPGRDGPLRRSFVFAGSADHAETWVLPILNARYRVTICVGGGTVEQGPHHVQIEGKQVIDKVFTSAGVFLETKGIPIAVDDGELTMIVGGSRSKTVSRDGTSDTVLYYIVIRKAP